MVAPVAGVTNPIFPDPFYGIAFIPDASHIGKHDLTILVGNQSTFDMSTQLIYSVTEPTVMTTTTDKEEDASPVTEENKETEAYHV